MAPPYVAVVGSGFAPQDVLAVAEEVGRGLGERGAVVVCGGLGGVMEAACRGARSAARRRSGSCRDSSASDGNPFVDVALPTGMGEARDALVARAADVMIAVGGEFGTLAEIALALKAGTPVVGLGTWELARDGDTVEAIVRVGTAAEAVERALALIRR